MLLEVSLILHANPLATIAARRLASVTTAGFVRGRSSGSIVFVANLARSAAHVTAAQPSWVVGEHIGDHSLGRPDRPHEREHPTYTRPSADQVQRKNRP